MCSADFQPPAVMPVVPGNLRVCLPPNPQMALTLPIPRGPNGGYAGKDPKYFYDPMDTRRPAVDIAGEARREQRDPKVPPTCPLTCFLFTILFTS